MGRAGRDGLKSKCVVFWAPKDFQTQKFLINKTKNKSMISQYMKLLQSMQDYVRTNKCRRKQLLSYFDKNAKRKETIFFIFLV